MKSGRHREQEGPKRGAPRKRSQVVNGLTEYLQLAKGDATLSLELVQIARRIGVSDDTIRNYGDDRDVRQLLQELRHLRESREEAKKHRAAAYAKEQSEAAALDSEQAGNLAAVSAGFAETKAVRPTMDAMRETLRVDAAAALSDDGLRRQIVHTMREIEAAMLAYAGRCRRERDERNVRRVAYDLDEALLRLHRLQATLRPLAEEYRRRDRASRFAASAALGLDEHLTLA